jgi:hypothetical protein
MRFRIARHTNNLEPLINFYTNYLGLELLGNFKNHSSYDGIFLGKKDLDWHLEFTMSSEKANHIFDEDDLLVFYANDQEEFLKIIDRFKENNIQEVKPKNPYWEQNGKMYLDPDGYRIVISNKN